MARKPAGRGTGLSQRPAGEPRGYGGPDRGYEPAGFDQSRGYEPSPRGYGERPVRSREGQATERLQPARRGPRYQDVPEPASPVGARVPRAAASARRPPVGMDTGPGTALYDTGPTAADFATTRISADPDLADSDVFPRVRADIPETEARGRPKNQAKGRGRPSRGRREDDDDDWPSTEWDKLSDEQYWAELSADKPLATTARSAQPSTAAPAVKPSPAARPSPAAKPSPAAAPARPAPSLQPLGAQPRGPRPPRTPGRTMLAAARPPTAPTAREPIRVPRGDRTARIPTQAARAWPTGFRRRLPSSCRPGTGASLPTPRPAVTPSRPRRPVARRAGPVPPTTTR